MAQFERKKNICCLWCLRNDEGIFGESLLILQRATAADFVVKRRANLDRLSCMSSEDRSFFVSVCLSVYPCPGGCVDISFLFCQNVIVISLEVRQGDQEGREKTPLQFFHVAEWFRKHGCVCMSVCPSSQSKANAIGLYLPLLSDTSGIIYCLRHARTIFLMRFIRLPGYKVVLSLFPDSCMGRARSKTGRKSLRKTRQILPRVTGYPIWMGPRSDIIIMQTWPWGEKRDLSAACIHKEQISQNIKGAGLKPWTWHEWVKPFS